MSDELMKKLDSALSKIAALEATQSSKKQTPAGPSFEEIRSAFARDPVGFAKLMGVPKEYVAQHYVADAMGQEAPAHLQTLRQMGPQIEQTSQLAAQVDSIVKRLEADDARARAATARESLKTTATDKTKYPHLSAALAKDPSILDELDAGGNAAELADKLERRFAVLGIKSDAPPASQANAVNAEQTTSQQVPAQRVNAPAGDPPPLPQQGTQVGFTEADAKTLRDEIDRKYKAGAYGAVAASD